MLRGRRMSKVQVTTIPASFSIADDLAGQRIPERYMVNKTIVTRESLGITDAAKANYLIRSDEGIEDTLIGDVCPVLGENITVDVLSQILPERAITSLIEVCTAIPELMPVISVKPDVKYRLNELTSNKVSHIYFSTFVGKSLSPKNQAAIDKMVKRSLFLNDSKTDAGNSVLLAMPNKQYTGNTVLTKSFVNLIDLSLNDNKAKFVSISSPPTNFISLYEKFKLKNVTMARTKTRSGIVILTFKLKDE